MWEDILKLRRYRMPIYSTDIDYLESFNGLRYIIDDLQTLCENLELQFTINNFNYREYNAEYDRDYHRMLSMLSSTIFDMARDSQIKSRSKGGLNYARGSSFKNRVYRETEVKIDSNRKFIQFIFKSYKQGETPLYEINMVVSFPDSVTSDVMLEYEYVFIQYFTDNFDNGNLNVKKLVDNIFNHLGITVDDSNAEGVVREKWWQ